MSRHAAPRPAEARAPGQQACGSPCGAEGGGGGRGGVSGERADICDAPGLVGSAGRRRGRSEGTRGGLEYNISEHSDQSSGLEGLELFALPADALAAILDGASGGARASAAATAAVLACTCRAGREAAGDPRLWRALCALRVGPGVAGAPEPHEWGLTSWQVRWEERDGREGVQSCAT